MEDYLPRLPEIPVSSLTKNIADILDTSNLPDIQHVERDISPKNIAFERYDENGEEKPLPKLHRAAFLAEFDIVESLISHGADLNEGNEGGFTVLHLAAQAGHEEIVQQILSHGADVNKETNLGATALHYASMNGHLDVTKHLIRHGATISKRCHDGTSALHLAAYNGSLPVTKFLSSIGAEVDVRKGSEVTPLHLAALNDHLGIVEYLISQGANVSHRNQFGLTALHIASFNGHVQVVECLIGHGAKINEGNANGTTALMLAAQNDHPGVTQLLINHGAEVNKEDENGTTALVIAAGLGHLRVIKCLVKHGAMVNKETWSGLTALIAALHLGHVDVIEYLCNHGAEVDMRNKSGMTALHLAAVNGQVTVIECLLTHGAAVNGETQSGETALHIAACNGQLGATESLVSHGLDINKGSSSGQTALHVPEQTCDVSVMECLIIHGAEVDKENINGWTALHFASSNGQIASTESLISHGASIDKRTRTGETALHLATLAKGHINVMQCLINHGADVTKENNKGLTALHLAVCNDCDASKCLIDHGARVDGKSHRGHTALMYAAQKGHIDVMECLIKNGADVNRKDSNGMTALHLVAGLGNCAAAECLIYRGADVNMKTPDGLTALHVAAGKGYLPATECLINHGAEVDIGNNEGLTALHVSATKGHVSITEYLLDHGSDVERKARDGTNALHLSVINGHLDVTGCLINHGADVNNKSNGGITALHLAAIKGDVSATECLVNYGAAMGSNIGYATTPLHLAATYNHLPVLELLLGILMSQSSGAASINEGGKSLIDQLDDGGFTALHRAIEEGHTAIVETLVSHGADLNIKSRQGETCLHLAIKMALSRKVQSTNTLRRISARYHHCNLSKEQALALFLLEHGADPYIVDHEMMTPVDLVQDVMFQQVILERIYELKQSTGNFPEQSAPKLVSMQKLSEFWILLCMSSVMIDRLCQQFGNQPTGDLQRSDHSSKAEENEEDASRESVPNNEDTHNRPRAEEFHVELERHQFVMRIPFSEPENKREIRVQELTETPDDLLIKEDEMVITFGLRVTSPGLKFSEPVKITMAHSGIFTKPDRADIVLYTRESSSGQFSAIPSTTQGVPRCVVRERDLDLYIDHFSDWWIVAVFKRYFIGKRLICTPYIPVSIRWDRMDCIYLFVVDDIGLKEETFEGYKKACPGEQFFIRWRKGDLTIKYFENDIELKSQNLKEEAFHPLNNHHLPFKLRSHEKRETGAFILFNLEQSIAKNIGFIIHFEDPPVAGQQESGKHPDKQRMKEPNDGDHSHQDTARTIKKDPGAKPKTTRDGGSFIRSQPGTSTKISSQISSVIDSSEGELSSTSAEVPIVPQSSSIRDNGRTTFVSRNESKTSSTLGYKGDRRVDGSGTSRAKKKKKSRGARGGKNKRKNDKNLPPPPPSHPPSPPPSLPSPPPSPPPPEIIDEVDSTASERDQMQLEHADVAEEQIGAMAPAGSMPNILQRLVQGGRMQDRTTNFAIYVDKMTINQPCGNTDNSTLVAMPTIVPVKLRHKLAILMNRESPVLKDWKGLADVLGLGEYITSLEDCKNPTEELIRLAESGQKIQNLHDLAEAFKRMERADCAELCRSYALDLGRMCPPEPTIDDDSDSSESF